MAAPPEIHMNALSGQYQMNKSLSDDVTSCLKLQGVSYLIRKGMGMVPFKNKLKQHTGEDKIVHIEIHPEGPLGKGHVDDRILDWKPRSVNQPLIGEVEVLSRFFSEASAPAATTDSADDIKFLNAETLADGKAADGFTDKDTPKFQTVIKSKNDGWTMEQIWGFENIDGARYHTRRMLVKKGDETQKARLVFGYDGAAE